MGGLHGRIESFKFGPGHIGAELPVDFGPELVARTLPGGNLFAQDLDMGDTTIQTLTGQHRKFTLRHIEPTAMLGGVVKLEFASNAACFMGREDAIQSGRGVGIEIIQDPADAFGRRELLIHQQTQLLGKIGFGPLRSDVDVTPTPQGLNEQKQISGTFAFIFRVITGRLAGLSRQGLTGFTGQLHRTFVETHLRIPGIFRFGIESVKFFV